MKYDGTLLAGITISAQKSFDGVMNDAVDLFETFIDVEGSSKCNVDSISCPCGGKNVLKGKQRWKYVSR